MIELNAEAPEANWENFEVTPDSAHPSSQLDEEGQRDDTIPEQTDEDESKNERDSLDRVEEDYREE